MFRVATTNGCIAGVRLTLEDGTDLADKVDPRLLSLTLTEKREGGADDLQLTLHNTDGLLAVPSAGKMLRLALGWVSGADVPLGLVDKGRFKVDEVEENGPPDCIIIRARSADLGTAHTKRRTRTWHQTTVGAVLTEIAGRGGSTASIHPDLAREVIDAIEQHNKSDAAFVADLGQRFDALATWKDGRLVFLPKGSSTTASGKVIPARTITRQDGWRWRFVRAERGTATGVEAQYYDDRTGQRKTVAEGGDDRQRLKHVYSSKSHATRAAKSNLAKRQRGKSKFEYYLAVADCSMLPNQRVTLTGWSDAVSNIKWVIESVETSLGPDGLKQRAQLEGA